MFRDYELRYVIASVAIAWLITILLAAYEIFINRSDTGLQTAVASAVGMAVATGITLLLVGTWEVFMVLARRLNERRLADARKEGEEVGLEKGLEQGLEKGLEKGLEQGEKNRHKRWQAWYDSLPDEFKNQQPAPPPPPDEEP